MKLSHTTLETLTRLIIGIFLLCILPTTAKSIDVIKGNKFIINNKTSYYINNQTWETVPTGGDTIFVLAERTKAINEEIPTTLVAQSVDENYFQIFQWLSLLDMNVTIIIILMVIVAVVNMMTALLVLIIDRTPMIGLLKALGGRNRLIRQSFLFSGARYLLSGLVLGNVIGLGLGFLQHFTGIVKLEESTYYLSKVPFSITLWDALLINGLTFGVCLVLLVIPAMYVARIQPVKAIRFN